jgi:hypothetical protein
MISNKIEKEREKLRESMRKHAGFVGIGIGNKVVKGAQTDEVCVTVFVKKKHTQGELGSKAVPSTIKLEDGTEVPTDVVETGELKFLGFTGKYRPGAPGCGIGLPTGMYDGTFGAVLTDNTNGKPVFLSCNHVIANTNAAPLGSSIIQPGAAFGGKEATDKIGTLKRFAAINLSPYGVNYVDAAIGTPTTTGTITSTPLCSSVNPKKQGIVGMLFAGSSFIGIINPIQAILSSLNCTVTRTKVATAGMSIHGCAATGGYISKNIASVGTDILLTADNGNDIWFMNQIIIPGGSNMDSGCSGTVFYTTFNT